MQLQKIEKSSQISRLTIAIAATFTAEPVEEALAFWLGELDIPSKIAFAAYNQVFQELLAPNSLLSQNLKGINIILVRLEDWEPQEERAQTGNSMSQPVMHRIEQNVRELAHALKASSLRSPSPQLLISCPPSPTALADSNRREFFKKMEELLSSELSAVSGVHLITASSIAAIYPVENYYDAYRDELGHVPYTPAYFTALGTSIARKIYALLSSPYKVIALDCDNTLWKGVCGEDGAMGIEIDPPRMALQEFMVAQNDAGMLICLCSKNNPADVALVFEKRKEMPLTRDRIVSDRINWQAKSENLKSLALELNLGLDSFIFIDDNPVECAEVGANCPEVLTLLLPSQPEDIPNFLNHIWAFDRAIVTSEDKQRTQLYQQNVKREQFRTSSLTLENFLEGLGLEVKISEMPPHHLARVSQLTERTNQFNFTTIRRSSSEIQQLSQSGMECLVVEVQDRFGDYGLVGVIIFAADSDTLKVDTFLLSCRTLGRGVEHQMLAFLGKIAQSRGCSVVETTYIPTQKNQPALNFIESVGSRFKLPLEKGLKFRFPVEVAAEISYQPDTRKEEAANDRVGTEDSKKIPNPQSPILNPKSQKYQNLIRIAKELYGVQQILKAIEVKKRRTRPEVAAVYVAPKNELEKVLENIWTEILGIDSIGVEDNFFELGGHSLLVTQLISRVRENFQVDLSMQKFFEAPTMTGLAEALTERKNAPVDANSIAQILKWLNGISESEAKAMLQEKLGDWRSVELEAFSVEVEESPQNSASVFESTQTSEDYYRCADIERVQIRGNLELVYSRNSRVSKILSAEVVELLSKCQQFKTLDDLARQLSGDRPEGNYSVEAIKNQLLELKEAGFLVSQQQSIEQLRRSPAAPATDNRITSVGIFTSDRLEGAKRSLNSYIENSLKYERTQEFVVMDDSRESRTRDDYRQMLRSLSSEYGVTILYAGLEEKQHFAKALIEKGDLPEEVVNFALFDVEKSGYSYGANRNAFQLHSVGEVTFSADDDTICKLVPSPELNEESLRFSIGYEAADIWGLGDSLRDSFASRTSRESTLSFVEKDNLAIHEQLLGKSVSEIISDRGATDSLDFHQIDTPLLQRLATGGRVLTTFNGLAGDCAWGAPFGYWVAPFGYLLLSGQSRDRLVQSESAYRAQCASREILRVVDRPTISDATFCMNTFVGLDNRQMLPPFLPVKRGQDLIFALSLWMSFPDAFFGHLPFALLHEPVEKRKFWPGEIFRTASGFDTAKLMIECVKSCEFSPSQSDSTVRMRAIASHLTELGSLPVADFEEFLRLQMWRSSQTFINLAEEQLRIYGESPAFWANDVKKYLDLLCQSLTRDDYCVPLDLVAGSSPSEARKLAQRLVFKFGQLLYWWPDMVEIARELRSRGQRLGTPL